MKIGKTFSLDSKLLETIVEEARIRKITVSEFLNEHLTTTLSNKTYQIVVCPKCGASYSERFPSCPNCDKLERDKEQEKVEAVKKEVESKTIGEKKMSLERLKKQEDDILRNVSVLEAWLKEGKSSQEEIDKQHERLKGIQEKAFALMGEIQDYERKNGHEDNQEGNEEAKVDSEAEPNKP